MRIAFTDETAAIYYLNPFAVRRNDYLESGLKSAHVVVFDDHDLPVTNVDTSDFTPQKVGRSRRGRRIPRQEPLH